MKISYQWLQTYVHLDEPAARVADRLTMSGLEVDGIQSIGSPVEGIVVGRVVDVAKHPNADRLTLCQVDLGSNAPAQIVCGAPNVVAGQMVPVAVPGTTLQLRDRLNPDRRTPFTIERTAIRGESSEGMICSEDELGLSNDHSGIMVLHEDAIPGESFASYLARQGRQASDAVLDVAVTPNRPDAVSHIGVARDLAALTQTKLHVPHVELPSDGGEAARSIAVEIEAPAACPRYVAMVVRGVRVSESPVWLRARLQAIGLRPRNNVVDITNFVMHECGQPLHAFDLGLLAGDTIRVRFSSPDESLVTLDSKERKLPDDTLLICDAERPVAIAGVMGGANSEVTDATTDVLIESAYFDPATIRRTARALGMQTDASYRFERGVDRDGQIWAAARAADLMAKIAGGRVETGVVDAHPIREESRQIVLRLESIERILGTRIALEEVERLLTAIGFALRPSSHDAVECTIPTFRPDITREIDVIEEIARLHGFDDIPEPTFVRIPGGIVPRNRPIDVVRDRVRSLLKGAGYREIYTNSLLRSETAEAFFASKVMPRGEGQVVETLNPISREMAALRPSLLPGALEVVRHNANRNERRLHFFELGRVFRGNVRRETVVRGYLEYEALLIASAGLRRTASWYSRSEEVDVFDVKGVTSALLRSLGVEEVAFEPVYEETELTEYYLRVVAGDDDLGVIGKLRPEVSERQELEVPLYFAELDLDQLLAHADVYRPRAFSSLSRFPRVERDLAFLVDDAQDVGPIVGAIRASASALLEEVKPFDLYRGKGVPEGRKSVAFSLTFGSDRTLTDQEVDTEVSRVIEAVRERFNADLRA